MFVRFVFFLLITTLIASCNKLSFKNNFQNKILDTIVDFSSVDTFPSFKNCDSLITKQKKADCFRTTIHLKIEEEIQKHQFTLKASISETVYVDLIINTDGKIELHQITSNEKIKKNLPSLDSVLQNSISKIPAIFPAIKRGIPVKSKYQLPIKIELE